MVARIRACRVCRDAPLRVPLPHAPRPVLRVSATARILIASQAPGTKVHLSGLPFTDASGDRLRRWMGVDAATFYDARRIAIAPMGFCFPGQDAKGGDLPPRRECAAHWHDTLFATLPDFDLVLAIGRPAQAYHLRRLALGHLIRPGLTETVAGWRAVRASRNDTRVYALPHPSWRNTGWLKRNPWFEAELLPELQADIAASLDRARHLCEGETTDDREAATWPK
ncbi:uracil-DNA glycosylase [Aquabacter spiritensis]|uniref:Uracil-DNA glycosylase n=1 Tax=Aquabacter spiritensis TaxID=933073 RepID=A0A4R3LS21_9HYPH|nr:uracil-DNA glycosylase [Aquabacter spiritensis]